MQNPTGIHPGKVLRIGGIILGIVAAGSFSVPWLAGSWTQAGIVDTLWQPDGQWLPTDFWALYRVGSPQRVERWQVVAWYPSRETPLDFQVDIWELPQLSSRPHLMSRIRWVNARRRFFLHAGTRDGWRYWPWAVARTLPPNVHPAANRTYAGWNFYLTPSVPPLGRNRARNYHYVRVERPGKTPLLWEFWIHNQPPYAIFRARLNGRTEWTLHRLWTDIPPRPDELVTSP